MINPVDMFETLGGPCQRCSGPGRNVDLVGGYHAVLCRSCANKFDSDCDVSREYETLCDAEARLFAAEVRLKAGTSNVDLEGRFLEAEKESRRARTAMWKWSEKWITGPFTVEELRQREARKTHHP